MRIKLIVLILIGSILSSFFINDLGDIDVSTSIYHIKYSQQFEQPLEIDYIVQCNPSDTHYSRKGMKFHKVDSIKTSDDKDYYKNVWDKGHMAPAGAFNCDSITLGQTFSYVNCALQHRDLNRGPWKYLEQYERDLAVNNNITVNICVDFLGASRLKTGAMIPTGFRKTIRVNGNPFKTYYFPNQSVRGSYENFLEKKW